MVSDKWRKEMLPEHCVSSVEIYDPVTATWTTGPELPNALCGAGILSLVLPPGAIVFIANSAIYP